MRVLLVEDDPMLGHADSLISPNVPMIRHRTTETTMRAGTLMPSGNKASRAAAGGPLDSMPTTSSTHYAGHSRVLTAFDRFASRVTRWAGSPVAFALAFLVILAWAVLGPAFGYSENWQLVINTGTTIVTFLMVFLIQQSQNKDSVALHLKLNELLAANRQASNRMIGIEEMDEQDLRDVASFYGRLAERAKMRGPCKETHSIDEEGMPTDPAGAAAGRTAAPPGTAAVQG